MEKILSDCLENRISLDELEEKYQPYLYFLYLSGKVVYVGQTVNVQSRIKSHMSSNKIFDSFSFIPFSKLAHLYPTINEAEADFICKICPPHNRSIPKNRLWATKKKISKLIYSMGGRHIRVSNQIENCKDLIIIKLTVNRQTNVYYYNVANLLKNNIINPLQFKKIMSR